MCDWTKTTSMLLNIWVFLITKESTVYFCFRITSTFNFFLNAFFEYSLGFCVHLEMEWDLELQEFHNAKFTHVIVFSLSLHDLSCCASNLGPQTWFWVHVMWSWDPLEKWVLNSFCGNIYCSGSQSGVVTSRIKLGVTILELVTGRCHLVL